MLRLASLIPLATLLAAPPPARNTCVDCHGDLLEEAGGDVHRAAGVSCTGCHHGDAGSEEPGRAMDPKRGFVAKPKAGAAAAMCGSCHADIEKMRVVNPRLPTDQLAQYRTSGHGKRAFAGDERVATCVSCHGAHGVRHVQDPASPVSKGKVVETCTGCHNAAYMAKAGRTASIPTDQLEKYAASVHGHRRLKEHDPSAPACTDCHGNHGAAPPGVYAVTHVCGKCHVTQAELFESSTHAPRFREAGVPPCTSCHNHHDILATSDEMLGTGEHGTCSTCHEPGDPCDKATAEMKRGLAGLTQAVDRADAALKRADRLGMDVERPTFELAAASEALVRARVVVHGFSASEFQKVIAEGTSVAAEVEKAAQGKLQEHGYRRKGLVAASAMLLLFAGLLALKASRLERRRLGTGPPPPGP